MRLRYSPPVALVAMVVLSATAVAHAQLFRPKADVTALAEADGARAGSPFRLAAQVALPEGLHVQSNAPRDTTLVPTTLTIEAPAGITVDEIVFPVPKDFPLAGQDEPLLVFDQHFVVGARITLAATVPAGDLALPARLRYQACNDQMCFAPATVEFQWTLRVVGAGAPVQPTHADVFAGLAFGTGAAAGTPPPAAVTSKSAAATAGDGGLGALRGFETVATTGGFLDAGEFIRFIRDAESGVVATGAFEGKGPLAILLIVFVGGLALNLTPCVLPMIPINLAIIGAGAQAGSRGRGFLLGSVYGAAMAVVYGVLGVIVILTAGSFGTINASPWFNVGIAAIFVVLALAMFDIIPIDFSRYSSGLATGNSGRGTLALAFTMGAISALLAGACVAPVVIQVVLFASNLYATGTSVALALPFVLGLGMALPWPLAGAGIAALPKPGMWMVRVKQAFGVLILATAAYYGYLGYTLFANRWVDSSEVASSVQEKLKEGWYASLPEGLAAAEREGKPVLIDLWATWCKNCLTMDTTTFADPEVKAALAGYVKIKVQAEDPEQEPAKSIMQHFKAVGLPTYAVIKRKAE